VESGCADVATSVVHEHHHGVAVIGFDCEAIQNNASSRIGLPAAMSAKPTVLTLSIVFIRNESDGTGKRVPLDERLEN
jgi:hypothetical protein